jgi:peptidoglycan hydrolase CwlO-like protein
LLALGRALSVGMLVAVVVALCGSGTSQANLAGRYAAGQQQAGRLQQSIQADGKLIQSYEGRIGNLESELMVIERSVETQEALLNQVTVELATARGRLRSLEERYAHGRRVLAAQLVADYESPQPTLVDVVLRARGFQDLLNGLSQLNTIAKANADTIQLINTTRIAVAAQTRRLVGIQARRKRATAAVLVERDEIAQLRLTIVGRELAVARDQAQKRGRLSSLRRVLARQAATLQREAQRAQAASFAIGAPPPGGCIDTPFVAHGGEFGFFPAQGTNYTVNEEPVIAARLDALGKALQLHLIGVSGYRTAQHSVEVGGYADDPHTKGEASDTPGVEGVPEATLERFCLTRPFPGAREADHIQELGSPS